MVFNISNNAAPQRTRRRHLKLPIPITSSWFTPLPQEFARIGISRGQPRGQSGYKMYRKLAPGPWYRSVSVDEYRERYIKQLAALDRNPVLTEIAELAEDRIPALLCFERPDDAGAWCHRGFVSTWLHEAIGIEVTEFGFPGSGCSHPQLPGQR